MTIHTETLTADTTHPSVTSANGAGQAEGAKRTPSLQERAMLVALTIGVWGGTRTNKNVVGEVAEKHQAKTKEVGRFTQFLVDQKALKDIKAIANAARQDHYDLTLPFDNFGFRILPAANYEAYTGHMRKHREAFEIERDRLIARYQDLVDQAMAETGTLFDRGYYPHQEEIAGRYEYKTTFRPIPESGHFVVDVAADQKEMIDAQTFAAVERAQADAWVRVLEKSAKLAEGLRAYADSETGERKRNFHDSLVNNVEALADMLPKLNFTGDKKLDDMARRLKTELALYAAGTLKESPSIREKVAEAAEKVSKDARDVLAASSSDEVQGVLTKMEGYFS